MSKVKNNRASCISQWQLSRIKMMLTERWPEVWAEVETRVNNPRDLLSAHESSRKLRVEVFLKGGKRTN